MKMTPAKFMEDFAVQTRPVDFYISPNSVARFQSDDRLWPVEVWIRVKIRDGNDIPQVWEMYVDPCDAEHGDEMLEREWRIRKITLTELRRISPAECPAGIISGCLPNDDESKFIVASWLAERDERGLNQ